MGASFTERTAFGKTAAQAFARALRDAQDYSGHQDGYSGDINSGDASFVLVTLPPRFSYRKFQALLEQGSYLPGEVEYAAERVANWRPGGFWNESGKKRGWKGQLRKAEAELARAKKALAKFEAKVPAALAPDFERYANEYDDKWGGYLAVELRGAEAKQYGYGATRQRGERLYIFFGYAPS